jgi:hypothetical protein
MVEYRCECCNYVTNKKSNFDNHNVSKKHLEKVNGSDDKSVTSEKSIKMETIYSQESNVSNDSYLTLKIRELENTLKLKDLEIESLKQIIKSKDETIDLIKTTAIQRSNQPQNQTVVREAENNINMIIEEVDSQQINNNGDRRITINDLSKDAYTLNEFFAKCIKNADETLYTEKKEILGGSKVAVLKGQYFRKDRSQNALKCCIDVVEDILAKIPVDKQPLVCINKKERKFWVKTKDGWLCPNKNYEHTEEEMFNFYKKVNDFLYGSFQTVYNKCLHGLTDYEDDENGRELDRIIDDKKFLGEELTEREKKRNSLTISISKKKKAFEDHTDCNVIDYKEHHEDFVKSNMLICEDEQIKVGFKHFKSSLANCNGASNSLKKFVEESDKSIKKNLKDIIKSTEEQTT